MSDSEIQALVLQPEVLEYLKKNVLVNLWYEETNCMGYDLYAKATLHGVTLGRDEDYI